MEHRVSKAPSRFAVGHSKTPFPFATNAIMG